VRRRLTVSCLAAQGWTGEMDFIDGVRISAEDMRKTLLGNDAVVLVAQHKERLAGCIKIEQLDNGDAEVGMFAVDPDLQSCGLGSALLDAAHHFAEEVLGAKETCMMVLDNRLDILAWYQARGYVVTDEKVNPRPHLSSSPLWPPLYRSFGLLGLLPVRSCPEPGLPRASGRGIVPQEQDTRRRYCSLGCCGLTWVCWRCSGAVFAVVWCGGVSCDRRPSLRASTVASQSNLCNSSS